jgi:branched-chain amino acid transport system permease protein
MCGKDTFSFRLQSLVLGAMVMGIGGSLYAHYARFVSPSSFEPLYGTFLIWVMLVLGGSGSNKGAIWGSFLVWGIWAGTDFLTRYFPVTATQAASLRIIVVAVLLELVLLWRPQGLFRRGPSH